MPRLYLRRALLKMLELRRACDAELASPALRSDARYRGRVIAEIRRLQADIDQEMPGLVDFNVDTNVYATNLDALITDIDTAVNALEDATSSSSETASSKSSAKSNSSQSSNSSSSHGTPYTPSSLSSQSTASSNSSSSSS